MKIIDKVKIKNDITFEDKINIVDTIVAFVISNDESGIMYTPYYYKHGLITGIALYLLEGISFEHEDENVYKSVISSKEVFDLIKYVIDANDHYEILDFIYQCADDIIKFRKEEYIHSLSDKLEKHLEKALNKEIVLNKVLAKVAENENKILSTQAKQLEYSEKVVELMTPDEIAQMNKKMLSKDFDYDKIAEIVTDKYLSSEIHSKNEKNIINSQAAKIKDLEKYKQEHDARNVKL